MLLPDCPTARLPDIAAARDITQRTAQNIVNDLEQAGYLRRERKGRRTQYTLRLEGALRRPADAHVPVQGLLGTLQHRPRRALMRTVGGLRRRR
ncbi:transcriptional regulator [Streptomyces sp. NPDC005386]|uniref:transcriptional regulator n=1 Tax=Streptomyces sp. NPDC005386 TaxID=3154562 RepID=UPI0033AC0D5E